MPKTTFVRKPICLDDVRDGVRWIIKHFGPERDSYYVAAERHLSQTEWAEFTSDLFADRDWIREFSNQNHPSIEGAPACIRVTGEGCETILLVDPQGYSYARYVAIESPA